MAARVSPLRPRLPLRSLRRQAGYLGVATRRALGGAGGGFSASRPDFWAPLTTSMALSAGSGSGTFTRATTAVVCDHEMLCRLVKSGEVRFFGARRVENLVPLPENIANGVGGVATTSATITPGIADPNGGTTAFTLTATGANGQYTGTVGVQPSGDYRGSLYIRRRTGTGTISFCLPDGSFGADIKASITSSWQRLATVLQSGLASGAKFHGLRLATSGDEVDIWHPQLENVTGQSNQAPSEYVSQGALVAPYHGANADGVKYFDYVSGNSVNSNVVTEAVGAAIGSSTLLGYLAEQQSTNLVLQSENFGTTWVANGTPTRSAAALRCGSVVLDLIGDDDGAALEYYHQDLTFTADAVKAISLYFAKSTSASTNIWLQDTVAPADRLNCVITWSGATPSITMTTGTLLGIDTLGNGVFRARLQTTSVTAANNNRLRIVPAANAAHSTADTGNVYIGGVQAENNAFCTSYIPTTTAAATRNRDLLTYPIAGNLDTTKGAMYAEFNTVNFNTSGDRLIGSTTGGSPLQVAATNVAAATMRIYDGTTIINDGSFANATNNRAVGRWAGAALSVNVNGGSITSGAFDGDMSMTDIIIGTGASNQHNNGTCRNVKGWKSVPTDAQMLAL